MQPIRFYSNFEFQYEVLETVSPLVRRIVAHNPGAFTGAGTNTYVIGHGHVALIDPGPASPGHTRAILLALSGEKIERILITHRHSDHWPAAAEIQRATGAPVYGFSRIAVQRGTTAQEYPDYSFQPNQPLQDGDVLEGPGWHLMAVHTPGHASDHLCFSLPEERVLFSGDHVMGWSTSVILPPDGEMAAYMRSLEKLLGRDDALYLPGHGPAITDPHPWVRAFILHRRERRDAILRRLKTGPATVEQIVDSVYVGLAPGLEWAAGQSVLAHLIELEDSGEVESDSHSGYRLAKAAKSATSFPAPR